MVTPEKHPSAVAFLQAAINAGDRTIARLQEAIDHANDDLEAKGLRSMLQVAQTGQDVIHDLLMEQLGSDALSLQASILARQERCQQQLRRAAHNWRRGQRTPPAYWEAETCRAVLTDLLRSYQDWLEGRPVYPDLPVLHPSTLVTEADIAPEETSGYAFPWYNDVLPGNGANGNARTAQEAGPPPSDGRYAALREALDDYHCRADHLALIAETEGQVIVTGYVHSDEELRDCLDALLSVEGIFEVLQDVRVVAPEHCPVCHPAQPAASPGGPAER